MTRVILVNIQAPLAASWGHADVVVWGSGEVEAEALRHVSAYADVWVLEVLLLLLLLPLLPLLLLLLPLLLARLVAPLAPLLLLRLVVVGQQG